MKRTSFAALVLLAACAPATPPADPMPAPTAPPAVATSAVLNPVGTFEFTTSVNGDMVTGSVEVTGNPGAYGGTIRTSATPDIPVTGVAVSGQQMVVTAHTPDGELTLTLNFTGNNFTGGWTLGGGSGEMRGQRKP
ncbi:MAG TPA: hypothetical protein VGX50_08925 [Longimicrobium sp.]|jgi:hypothetical protein|nr:hypothetical protein [Longimicrobium sp.]